MNTTQTLKAAAIAAINAWYEARFEDLRKQGMSAKKAADEAESELMDILDDDE